MMIENRDALLKEREIAKKKSTLTNAGFSYVPEPAALPPALKKYTTKCWNCAMI